MVCECIAIRRGSDGLKGTKEEVRRPEESPAGNLDLLYSIEIGKEGNIPVRVGVSCITS